MWTPARHADCTVRRCFAGALRTLVIMICVAASPTSARPDVGSSAVEADVDEYQIGPEDVLEIVVWGREELGGSIVVGFDGHLQLPVIGEVRVAGSTTRQLQQDLTERFRLFDSRVTEVIVRVIQYNANKVTVIGQVQNPGIYGFRQIPDIWSVLLRAGGAGPQADLARLQVIHEEEEEGLERALTIDVSAGIEDVDPRKLPILRSGDSIVVPSLVEDVASGDRFRVFGAVRSPGLYRISAAESVLEALALSGGVTESADLSRVRLTRNANGSVVSYTLDLESYLSQATPMANLQLQADDTVTIPQRDSFFTSTLSGVLKVVPLVTVTTSLILAFNR